MSYETFRVAARHREPLVDFIVSALHTCGCVVLNRSPASEAPFRISFATPWGERMGIIAYAFLANSRLTRNRPPDEYRFQIKYGSKDGRLHSLWQDPFGVYTTLLLGIDPDQGFFVSADPVLNDPTLFFISKEFKQRHVDRIMVEGWHAWERAVRPVRRKRSDDDGVEWDRFENGREVLVGGTAANFLRCVLFERDALGEDQGHRRLLADRYPATGVAGFNGEWARSSLLLSPARMHELERELELGAAEVMELISRAPRLKMAVRGWVAERHLRTVLENLPSVTSVVQLEIDGRPDFEVTLLHAKKPVLVECKNVLRGTDRNGYPRLDFMRTRASKANPCSRYYSRTEFDVIAACLHAQTEQWTFAARCTEEMQPHARCAGKLAHRVVVDDAWSSDLEQVLKAATR